MVFMVSSVQVHVVGVKQKVGEQEHDHFDRLFPTVHKVPIKHIRRLRRGKAILNSSNVPNQHTGTNFQSDLGEVLSCMLQLCLM